MSFRPRLTLAALLAALALTGCDEIEIRRPRRPAWRPAEARLSDRRPTTGGWHDVYRPLDDEGRPDAARARLVAVVRVLRRALALEAGPAVARFLAATGLAEGRLDLDEIHRLLRPAAGPRRAIDLVGRPDADRYRLVLSASPPPEALGAATIVLSMERIEPVYALALEVALDTGPIDGPAAGRATHALLDRLASAALARRPPSADLPRTAGRLAFCADVGGAVRDGRLDLEIAARRDLGRTFPELAGWLGRLGDLLVVDARLDPIGSDPPTTVRLETRRTAARLVCPAPAPLAAGTRRGRLDLDLTVPGLRFAVGDLPFEATIDPGPERLAVAFALTGRTGTVDLEHGLLSGVGSRFLRSVAGLDLDALALRTIDALSGADGGPPARLALDWGPVGDRNRLAIDLRLRLPASPLVGLAYRLFHLAHGPEGETLGELLGLLDALLEAFERDLTG